MKKPVLVLGGGIAGIQASLDLAEMNIPVFLVESSPSIGGRMAQLDKTFPTNDCSACILAPKVTSCYSHPLVKTFTWSELIDIKGEAPNFTAVIRKKARFIDEDLCRGCNACTLKCPVTVKSEFEMGMGDRRAVFKPFAQAVPNIVTIDKKGTAPCKYQCPAHMDVNGYVVLAGQGRFEEALQLIRRTTPFAGVLGRVCAEDCKANCYRRHVDEPLALGALKRFIADYELEQGKSPKLAKGKAKETKVAVIGSGPAGLNCAYQLALMGYQVTVFEALPVPGGMLRTAIPAYRLDRKVLDREIALVQSLGVEIRCNSPVGKELTLDDLRQQGYKAFFLATGAQKEKRVGIPGETLADVISCREFLQDLNLTGHGKPGRKVVVIGGGYGALDAARSALRLGSEATVLYSGKEEDMAATPTELAQAKEEGVRVEILTSPVEILGDNGHAVGVKCRSGITGQEWIVPADTVIIDNAMVGDVENFDINEPDVFVGGAAVTGIGSVIQAIAEGNRAAKRIYNYLEGANMDVEPFVMEQTPVEAVKFPVVSDGGSCEIPTLDREQRIRSFAEVELGIQSPEEAQAEAQRCLNCSVCAECRACEKVCPPKAIRHEQRDEIIAVEVSSVIMAAGYDPVSEIPDEFGYSRSANVVTSMEYERILSASGPYQGHVRRPSDGRVPQRIAFIQCVGSRDEKCDASYCSAVCCMYAVKEAIITREHLPQVKDIDIFYMDMRAYGKDFDKYVDSAQNAHGVRFVKSRVAEVVENPETGGLIIKHCGEDGRMTSSEYDMVVLSVGLRPKPEVQDLLAKSGVKTNRFDFNWVHEMKAPATSREGIFACGVSAGPKDIPETVMEASAAASMASRAAGMTEVSLKDYAEYFKEEEEGVIRDVSNQPIRIGVFVCHCGTNIAGFLDVKEVARYARSLPFVVFSRDYLYACSVDTQKTIADTIKRLQLNRVVIASCTPRTHEPLFQQVLVKAGLNPYLVTMANIRDQCSWVHMQEYEEATEKAKDLVRMAVGKVTFAKPLTRQKVGVNKEALVIGGGMAGMTAALEIAGMGYKTYLVEREGRLGGYGTRLASSPTGRYYPGYVEKTMEDVVNHPLIEVFTNTEVKRIDGYVGQFTTVLESMGQERELSHGVVVLATGARERKPREYLYGANESVLTQMDLEGFLQKGGEKLEGKKNIVMIQCVGSRDEERPYCSRVCCNQAIKNALALKEMDPDRNITILYRDIRAYGLHETNYRRARRAGIQFIHYEPDRKPVVRELDGRLTVEVYDDILDASLSMAPDLLVLSAAIEPSVDENKRLAQMLKVPLNQDGFFLEAHAKLRPVDFATDGVFLCGLAHAPKNLQESIAQGRAAAARAMTVISKDSLETEGAIAQVSEQDCTGCGTCEKVCAYKAISMKEIQQRNGTVVRKANINPVLCKGCGTCSATCRCGAIDVNGFADRQVLNEIEYLLRME